MPLFASGDWLFWPMIACALVAYAIEQASKHTTPEQKTRAATSFFDSITRKGR